MAPAALVAELAGRCEAPGLPVLYAIAVRDERGRRHEVRRRYSEFAALVRTVWENYGHPLPQLPPPIPLAGSICGMLDRREAGLAEVLDALVCVARRCGDDAPEIRTFLELGALRRSASASRRVSGSKSAGGSLCDVPISAGSQRMPTICEAAKEDSLGVALPEESLGVANEEDSLFANEAEKPGFASKDASNVAAKLLDSEGFEPSKLKGAPPPRGDGLPVLLGRMRSA